MCSSHWFCSWPGASGRQERQTRRTLPTRSELRLSAAGQRLVVVLCLSALSCAKPVGSFAPPSDLPDPPEGYWEEVVAADESGCCDAMLMFEASCISIDNENDAVRGGKVTRIVPE